MFALRFAEDARHRLARQIQTGELDLATLYHRLRGTPDDLRALGLAVAVHNDYRIGGVPHTFWLMTHEVKTADPRYQRTVAYKGEGKSDAEALDQIRAAFARENDNLHHAPLCPANHYHGMRAPTGACNCGAAAEAGR